jgi:type I restriction enzyme, R subunit
LLYDLAGRLFGLQILDDAEARAVAAVIADRTREVSDHGRVYALLAPAVERYRAKSEDEQSEARDLLDQYVRAYSFMSHVVDFGDVGLEALYLASRALLALLPPDGGGRLDLGAEVELTHLRIERTSEGSITPDKGIGELKAIYSGRGPETEEEKGHLSKIVEVLNERFEMTLGTADQLFFDQMEASWLEDEHLVDQARANSLDNFRLVFNDKFISTMVARMDDNEDLFKRVLDDREFQAAVMEHYLRRVFTTARRSAEGGT